MPIDSNVLRQKALSLHEDFKKESTEEKVTKPFTAVRDGCIDSGIGII
jgi:hypothetical protein